MQVMNGIDEDVKMETSVNEETIIDYEKEKKKRKPFHIWEVNGIEYKMKLTAAMVVKLDEKYKVNLTNLVLQDGMPPLSVMLTIAQAAISPWKHGINFDKVCGLFDAWVEEGGNQQLFFSNVILPAMMVSGFFTTAQTESLCHLIETAETN